MTILVLKMNLDIQEFYGRIKSKISKDGDLPNYFTYFLTVDLGREFVTVAQVRKCYEECDLHPPSWLASHFSIGLRSNPRRFVKKDRGYRLERNLLEKLAHSLREEISSTNPPDQVANQMAGIEYMGVAGASADCQRAVVMLLQSDRSLMRARILTSDRYHCILLVDEVGDRVAIKSGFSSGYSGEGPRALSYVLQLLVSHKIDIDEIKVEPVVFGRVDSSSLTSSDLDFIVGAKPVRPPNWSQYIDDKDSKRAQDGILWKDFPPLIPFAIIDSRLMDLAISFWENPDDRLLKAYRRLEDSVRRRTGVDEHGSKLFSQAFIGNGAKLGWAGINDGEKIGRAQLFTSVYMAYRNPRAHRELEGKLVEQLAEFLMLNHLYLLEREALPLA